MSSQSANDEWCIYDKAKCYEVPKGTHGEYRFSEKKFKHFSRTFSRIVSQFSRTFSVSFQVHPSKEIQGNSTKS